MYGLVSIKIGLPTSKVLLKRRGIRSLCVTEQLQKREQA